MDKREKGTKTGTNYPDIIRALFFRLLHGKLCSSRDAFPSIYTHTHTHTRIYYYRNIEINKMDKYLLSRPATGSRSRPLYDADERVGGDGGSVFE